MNDVLKKVNNEIYNPKIPRYEKISRTNKAVDSNGWTKVVEHDKIVYFKNYMFTQKIEGNAWTDIPSQNLPVDIEKFDSSRMSASLSVRHSDSAVCVFASLQNNANQIFMTGQNKYSGAVTSSIVCNFVITVYS